VLQTNWAHRGLESAAPAGALLLQRVLLIIGVVLFIHSTDHAPTAMLLQGGAEIIAAMLLLGLMWRTMQQRPSVAAAGSVHLLVRAAWPFCVSRALRGLPVVVVTTSLAFFWHDADTGYFGAAYRVAVVLLVTSTSFGLATFPALSRAVAIGGQAESDAVSAMVRLLIMLVLPIAVGGIVLAREMVTFLFSQEFAPAVGSLRLLLGAMLLAALSDNLRRVLHARHRQRQDLAYVALATALSLASACVLLPIFGALGASAALLFGEGALLVFVAFMLYGGGEGWMLFAHSFTRAAVISVVVALAALVGLLLHFVLAAGLVALAYCAALWWCRKSIVADLATLELRLFVGGGDKA